MFDVNATVTKPFPSAEKIVKSFNFGTMVGINKTLDEAQNAVVGALQGTFTLRGNWWQPSNRFGIRIRKARYNEVPISGVIGTNADWLLAHEEGVNKTAKGGGDVAVPTDDVRRNKRLIIPRGQRPKGLGGKAFKLMTKHGPMLVQRLMRGKRKGLVFLYNLEKSVRIRKQSTFFEPIRKVVDRRMMSNISREVDVALKNMR